MLYTTDIHGGYTPKAMLYTTDIQGGYRKYKYYKSEFQSKEKKSATNQQFKHALQQ